MGEVTTEAIGVSEKNYVDDEAVAVWEQKFELMFHETVGISG